MVLFTTETKQILPYWQLKMKTEPFWEREKYNYWKYKIIIIYVALPGISMSVLGHHVTPFECLQQQVLVDWVDNEKCMLIFTCGGTGFSARDVTPEVTV